MKKQQKKEGKPVNASVIRRELIDLAWLYENTSISQEAYERTRKAILRKLEAANA